MKSWRSKQALPARQILAKCLKQTYHWTKHWMKQAAVQKNAARLCLCAMFGTLFFGLMTGLTQAQYCVVVHEDGEYYSRYTSCDELDDILDYLQITLDEMDRVEVVRDEEENRIDLTILRAFQVTVTADGQTELCTVNGGTVSHALTMAGITVGEEDLVNVALDAPLQKGMNIRVSRVTKERETMYTAIPYEESDVVATKRNQKAVVTVEGEDGELKTVAENTYVDGKLVQTEVISETVTKEPVNEVKEIVAEAYIGGYLREVDPDSLPVELDENGIPVNYSRKVVGKATAYSALGRPTKLTPGCVAMNLSQFPRGTQLYIRTTDGSYVYGYSRVADTGIAVNAGTVLVDCYFVTYEESVRFGAKTVEVYVLN